MGLFCCCPPPPFGLPISVSGQGIPIMIRFGNVNNAFRLGVTHTQPSHSDKLQSAQMQSQGKGVERGRLTVQVKSQDEVRSASWEIYMTGDWEYRR